MSGKDKNLCVGCRNDYYNSNRPEGCWCYGNAKVVLRTKVGVWDNPPYTRKPVETLSCHSPEGQVWLKEQDVRFEAPA